MASGQITIGSLIAIARQGGWDPSRWSRQASPPPAPPQVPANDPTLDLSVFDAGKLWNNIPRRDWIMAPILIAKHYSMLIATGASGKSAVAITTALALVTGRSDLLDMHVDRHCKVIVINGEDGPEELMRRVRATCQHFNIDLIDVQARLLIIGARQIPGLSFNHAMPGRIEADEKGLAVLDSMVRQFGAEVVIIDPLSNFLPGGTNDGASASAVAGRLTEICVNRNCAMLLVHHVSKSSMRDGDHDPTAALGSAMWANHARSIWNARRPTDAEAQRVGRPPSAVRNLLMLMHSKANLSRAEDAVFIELVGAELPNAQPPKHPRGDIIGVAQRLRPGSATDLFPPATIKAVLDKIATGTTIGSPYKATGRVGAQDYRPDISSILRTVFPNETEATREKLALELVKQLLEYGWLTKSTVTLPRAGSGKGGGKRIDGLFVDWSATQWAATPGPGPFALGTGAPQGTTA